ncbi:MAG: hypothetical protein IJ001_07925 [Oscillospiraceae bacterium]|nr:hypothetical protein [Oscillospiraceae bacterium]
MTDPQYKLEEDGYFIEKDGIFSIDVFMHDLERFYQAMRMHFALVFCAPSPAMGFITGGAKILSMEI